MSKVYKKRLIRPLLKAQDKLNKQDKSISSTTTPSSPEKNMQEYTDVNFIHFNYEFFQKYLFNYNTHKYKYIFLEV